MACIVDESGFCVGKMAGFDLPKPTGKDKSYIFDLTRMDINCILSTTQLRNCIKEKPNLEHPTVLKDKWNNEMKKSTNNEWTPTGQMTRIYTSPVWTDGKTKRVTVPCLRIIYYHLIMVQ